MAMADAVVALALELAGEERELLRRLVQVAPQLNDKLAAAEIYSRLARTTDETEGRAEWLRRAGRALLDGGYGEDAIVHFAEAVWLEPGDVNAAHVLARLYFDSGAPEEVVHLWQSLMKRGGHELHPAYHLVAAKALVELERIKEGQSALFLAADAWVALQELDLPEGLERLDAYLGSDQEAKALAKRLFNPLHPANIEAVDDDVQAADEEFLFPVDTRRIVPTKKKENES